MYAVQLMQRNFISIDSEEEISKALPLFEKTDAIVVMENGEYKGIITEKDIIRAKIPLNAKVKNFLKHPPKIKLSTPIEEIARLMLESDIYHLPVFEDEKIVGIVRDEDILKKVIEKEFGEEEIRKYMTPSPIVISPDDNIGKVIKIFKEKNISRLPVVEEEKIVGIITIEDILEKVVHPEEKPEYGEFIAEKKRYLKIPVKGIMDDAPIMQPSAKVKEVVEKLLKTGGILIGANRKLEGIVTKKDLLEPIASHGREEKVFVQLCGEIDKIDKDEALAYINEFVRKYEDFLENGYLYAYIKQHKEKKHGMPLIYCKIRISSPKKFFIADDDGWGLKQALKKTISALEKQIEREKS